MADIIFKDNRIQKGHRIKIPKAIVDTLELKEGQKIKINFNANKKKMVVEIDEKKK